MRVSVRTSRGARRRRSALAGSCWLLVVVGACGTQAGQPVVACPAVGYVPRLEVRLADAWPDRDSLDVQVTCLPGADPCLLVRDGTVVLLPEPGPGEDADAPVPPDVTGPRWEGAADGTPAEVEVRVLEVGTGATVLETTVALDWRVVDHPYGPECGGPSAASFEVAVPRS